MPSQRTRKPLRESMHHQRRIAKKLTPARIYAYVERINRLHSLWVADRGGVSIVDDIRRTTGVQLVEELRKMGDKKKKLNILEDGPGSASFTELLKHWLKLMGVKTHIDAYSFIDYHHLRLPKSGIDELHTGLAELHIPTRRYNYINSAAGSIMYAPREWQKDHLLKLAHALNVGGLMTVGFFLVNHDDRAILGTLLQNTPKRTLAGRNSHSKLSKSWDQEKRAIERAFQKRGFDAHFYKTTSRDVNIKNWLVIRRVR